MPFDIFGWLEDFPPDESQGARGRIGQQPGHPDRPAPEADAGPVGRPARKAGRPKKEQQTDRTWRLYRAQEFLLGPKFKASILGKNGSDALIDALCVLIEGYDLTSDEVSRVIYVYNNVKCIPPWDDREIAHAIESAEKKVGAKPRGKIFAEEPRSPKNWKPKKHYKPVEYDIEEINRKVAIFVESRSFDLILSDKEFINQFSRLSISDPDEYEVLRARLRENVKNYRDKIFERFIETARSLLIVPVVIPDRAEGEGEQPDDNDRPEIIITTEEYDVTDQAIDALSVCPDIFQRSNILVTVIREKVRNKDKDEDKNGQPTVEQLVQPPANGHIDKEDDIQEVIRRKIARTVGTPKITILSIARIRDLMTQWARWIRMVPDPEQEGEFIARASHPPDWGASSVSARGHWKGVDTLEAIVETPILRPNGTILDRPGYDEDTGILFEPNGEFPTIPEHPTHADAVRSASDLIDLVENFPFVDTRHGVAWLAGALTPFARFAIGDCCPLFLFDANMPGIGKSKLCDIISILATGRKASRTIFPESDDEMRKRITSIAMAGDRLVLIDNIEVGRPFGGSAIDSAITATFWKDRILGRSEMTSEIPLNTIWYATGNNITLKGDIIRRIILSRMFTDLENPESRSNFRHPDILGYVEQNRGQYVRDCLVILRSYFAAGCPKVCKTTFGSFEAWSDIVRSAIVWTTGQDPCSTQVKLRVEDQNTEARMAIIGAWDDFKEWEQDNPGGGRAEYKKGYYTSAEILECVNGNPEAFPNMRALLASWSKNDSLPTTRVIGSKLRSCKGQVINGKCLCCVYLRKGFAYWTVATTEEIREGGGIEEWSRRIGGSQDTDLSEEGSEEHDGNESYVM